MATGRLVALAVVAALTAITACGRGGVSGIVGGPVPDGPLPVPGSSTPPDAATTTVGTGGALGGTTVPDEPSAAPATATTTAAAPSPPPSAATAPAPAMRLDGDDLGVTRVGAPFRGAVSAVAAALGRPTGDPAADTSCVGSEDETTWGSFRLASSGGRVSGWLSFSTSLTTPAGARVGTTLTALRQAYGSRLELPPPAPDSDTIFLVSGGQLGGTLTGLGPPDTVTSISNGTCKPT